MNFVDKQDVPGIQVAEHGRQISRLFDHRTRRCLKGHTHFLRHDIGQGRLAQTRRTEDEGMVQRIGSLSGSLDENTHLLFNSLLADIFLQ